VSSNMVSMDAYAPGYLSQFGPEAQNQLASLNKALMTTGLNGVGTPGDGSPIRVQSLEQMLRVITFTMSDLRLWPQIQKVPAYNVVEEYNILRAYGGRSGLFAGEGALQPANDSLYERMFARIKFAVEVREISHPTILIQSAVGDIVTRYATDATYNLLGKMENALFFSDSSINQFAFDGIERQIMLWGDDTQVLDKRGQGLTPDDIEISANILRSHFGNVGQSRMYMPPGVLADFTRNWIPFQRTTSGEWKGKTGNPFSGWQSQFGDIEFQDDVFMVPANNGHLPNNPFVQPAGVPATPGTPITAAAVNAVASGSINSPTESLFDSVTPGGSFYYFYTAVNTYGESMASPASNLVTVGNGQYASLTIARILTQPLPSAYKIYRGTLSDGSDALYMTTVKDPGGSSTTFVYTDGNQNVPGTSTVFLLDMSPGVLEFKQLGPMMKLDLAPINLMYRFALVLYGTPVLTQPTKSVVLKNVGSSVLNRLGLAPINLANTIGPIYAG